eukprot:CAMPEP_0119497782 /NCGR_PEP_ID=MMETSP1344-20130328/20724_1 /TAXON_ID=236787 /ORGANISM="Florenciella parvula, Strain CCMP2471" /LENGTH=69 /DNA_ID=CAMNT_0007533597 /DNA_START=357 /DNA_END=563 /DNA_ORIENTATION=-
MSELTSDSATEPLCPRRVLGLPPKPPMLSSERFEMGFSPSGPRALVRWKSSFSVRRTSCVLPSNTPPPT